MADPHPFWLGTLSRVLVGGVFALSGANGLLHLVPEPVPPTPQAAAFVSALQATGYAWELVKATELVGGLLVLAGASAPLGLVVLAPVLVNILCFGVFLAPAALPIGVVLAIAALSIAWSARDRLTSLWR